MAPSVLNQKAKNKGQYLEEFDAGNPPTLSSPVEQPQQQVYSNEPQQSVAPPSLPQGNGYAQETFLQPYPTQPFGAMPAPQGPTKEPPTLKSQVEQGYVSDQQMPFLGSGNGSMTPPAPQGELNGQQPYQGRTPVGMPEMPAQMPTAQSQGQYPNVPNMEQTQANTHPSGLPMLDNVQGPKPQDLAGMNRVVSDRNNVRQENLRGDMQKSYSYHDLVRDIPNFDEIDKFVRSTLTQEYGKQIDEVNAKNRSGVSEGFAGKVQEFIYNSARRKAETSNVQFPEALLRYYVKYLFDDVFGLSVLQDLLDDDSVTEIWVYNERHVDVERKGKIESTNVVFRDKRHVKELIDRIIAPLGREINELNPNVDGRLPNKSRVSATIPPIAIDGPTISIRKFPKRAWTGDDLISFGSMNEEMLYFLQCVIRAKLNMFVSGGTGSGKTVTLNALSHNIDPNNRILTIEDLAELQLNHPKVEGYEARPGSADGKGKVEIRDILKWALRKRPDCVIVGECRGGEALDMLQALNTGHYGYSTGHANSPRDLINRLMTMVWMAGVDWPSISVIRQISNAIDFIVQVSRLRDGTRKIVKITEIAGVGEDGAKAMGLEHKLDDDHVYLNDIYEWVETGMDRNGMLEGEFRRVNKPILFRQLKQIAGLQNLWKEDQKNKAHVVDESVHVTTDSE